MLKFGKPAMLLGGAYMGVQALRGFTAGVAPSAIDAGMDVAFGDPQADRGMLGTDLSPSMLYGASSLPGAGIARNVMNPIRFRIRYRKWNSYWFGSSWSCGRHLLWW